METCQRCGEIGDDRRTLWMACLYAMDELDVPFTVKPAPKTDKEFFTLKVCKECRADWMLAIQEWFRIKPEVDNIGSGYYVRELGATREKPLGYF